MDPTEDGEMDVLDDDIAAKVLDTNDRKALSTTTFAFPRLRKLPLNDASHVRNALARFNQTQGMTPAEKATARAKIHRAAKKFGVKVEAELDDADHGHEDMAASIQAMQIQAVSLDLPKVDNHPNRMPFSGILTRIDVASDKAPHGSNGKRIMLTRAAAEAALPSLLGMGVDLKQDFGGHDAQNKVGIITAAHIDGDAIHISGFIYCADFPREALRIQLNKADLGFSFEAANIGVESMQDDPLIIKRLSFTGAAILMKDEAAYQTTALAAAKAKEHEMDDVQDAVKKAIEAALAPVTAALQKVAAAQSEQAAVIDELKKTPEIRAIEANAAMCARVEPHASGLEAAADGMEQEGIGVASPHGHIHHLRRMASSMRADAARGKLPHEYHDSGSYWAGADQSKQHTEDDDVNVKDTPEFKELKASADQTAKALKDSQDELAQNKAELANVTTILKDIQAQMKTMREPPSRKTLDPAISSILARAGIQAPEEDGAKLNVAAVTAALRNVAGMEGNTSSQIAAKLALARAGLIDPSTRS